MTYRIYIVILFLLPIGLFAQSQAKVTLDYINKFKGIAIKEMKRTGIPASITLAQAIVESGSGESKLAKEANNHFGIKCKTEWTGEKIYKDDDMKNECFRVYANADSSFIDHSNFLKYRPYYASLFELDPVDDTAWAYGLKKSGYATEKDYPNSLLKVIDLYELSQYNFPELVDEDSLTEANAIGAEQQKDTVVKQIAANKVAAIKPSPIVADSIQASKAQSKTDSTTINKDLQATPIRDTVVKIVTVKDTIVKIVKVTDTIVNTVTIKDTIVQIVKVKDTLEKTASIQPIKETTSQVSSPKAAVINYPLNQQFKINQVSAIWAVAGRSFLEIATTYNIDLFKIYTYNELQETDLVIKDQLLFLGEKKKTSGKKVHIAKNGESFYEISQMEGIQLSALKSYNTAITEDKIKDGTIIYLFNMPKEAAAPSTTTQSKIITNKNASEKSINDKPTPKKNKFKLF
jgi:hypothetical protein